MNERHTEYGVGVASELSDDYKPKKNNKKENNKKKKIRTLSTTTSTEELLYPMIYYFNPELYLNLINNWSMPNHNNPICKKINKYITKTASTVAVAEEIAKLNGDDSKYIKILINEHNKFQLQYVELVKLSKGMTNNIKLIQEIDRFEPVIIDENTTSYKNEDLKTLLILIKESITRIIKNLRRFYDDYYGPGKLISNTISTFDDYYEGIDKDIRDNNGYIFKLSEIFPSLFTNQEGGTNIADILKKMTDLDSLDKAGPSYITDNEYKTLGMGDYTLTPTIVSKPELEKPKELDAKKYVEIIQDDDKIYEHKYFSEYKNYDNAIAVSAVRNIETVIETIQNSDLHWLKVSEIDKLEQDEIAKFKPGREDVQVQGNTKSKPVGTQIDIKPTASTKFNVKKFISQQKISHPLVQSFAPSSVQLSVPASVQKPAMPLRLLMISLLQSSEKLVPHHKKPASETETHLPAIGSVSSSPAKKKTSTTNNGKLGSIHKKPTLQSQGQTSTFASTFASNLPPVSGQTPKPGASVASESESKDNPEMPQNSKSLNNVIDFSDKIYSTIDTIYKNIEEITYQQSLLSELNNIINNIGKIEDGVLYIKSDDLLTFLKKNEIECTNRLLTKFAVKINHLMGINMGVLIKERGDKDKDKDQALKNNIICILLLALYSEIHYPNLPSHKQ